MKQKLGQKIRNVLTGLHKLSIIVHWEYFQNTWLFKLHRWFESKLNSTYCSLLEELKLANETNLSNPQPQKGIYSSSGRLANLVAQNVCNLNKV